MCNLAKNPQKYLLLKINTCDFCKNNIKNDFSSQTSPWKFEKQPER